ncbi:hypothetical protein ACHHYP_04110 [Achlya hypogyna]|uniref:RRM domain-containing protein n=1 Tax=Achlya hypogyna TaxID=1202772 RepID=A0A1V9Z2N8_ACHHY|nr:hypothetical protein ACHHYP_04110 [Achlya hypogyna]
MSNFASFGSTSWADDDNDDHFHAPARAAPAPAAVEEDVHHGNDARDESHRGRRHSGENQDRRPRRGSHEFEQKREKLPVPDRPPFKSYVGNLPYQMNEDDLADFFKGLNVIDVHIPQDYQTGRPKGFAYVEFGDRESLVQALTADGDLIDKRPIRIDVAGEKKGGRDTFGKRGGDRGYDRGYGQRDGGDRYQRDERPRAAEAPKERPKLALAPRTKSSEEKAAAQRASIFGDAKPRDESKYLERKKAEAEKPKQDDREQPRGGRGERPATGGRGAGRGDKPAAPSRSDGDWVRGGAAAAETKPKAAAKKTEKKEPAKAAAVKAPASTKVVNAFSMLDDGSDSD